MDNEVKLKMENIINKLLPEALAKGLEKAGQIVENDAKRRVAVDDGTLRASITHKVEIDEGKVSIGSNIQYAPYIEFGSGVYNPEGRKTAWIFITADGQTWRTEGQEAQPFLQPAVDENTDKILQAFEGLLREE